MVILDLYSYILDRGNPFCTGYLCMYLKTNLSNQGGLPCRGVSLSCFHLKVLIEIHEVMGSVRVML